MQITARLDENLVKRAQVIRDLYHLSVLTLSEAVDKINVIRNEIGLPPLPVPTKCSDCGREHDQQNMTDKSKLQ